jgi:fermentation-respiration switch protein FrsA (DUF1100 family)
MQKRQQILPKILAVVLISLGTFVLAAVWGLRKVERVVAFAPERSPHVTSPTGASDAWFVNPAGNRLHGWFFSANQTTPLATILYFHGNGGNIENVAAVGTRFAARGFNVLVFDYRGYGESEGILEDEDGLYADADAAYNYLIRERGLSPESLVLYGHSLGTAAAIDLASRRKCGAVISEAGPSSGSEMAKRVLPWLPTQLHFLARNKFDSAHKLRDVHCPVLIAHGENDETIPPDQARILFAAANEPKQLVMIPNVSHNIIGEAGDDYFALLADFMRSAIAEPPEPAKQVKE